MNKINYRPEIDGLRAIAVFGVIIYHSKLSLWGVQVLQGGFFGVDIFFVISGYLISKIIISEYKEQKKFSYINFYERRMRRILPVLFFILLSTLIIGYFLLLPSVYSDNAKSLLSSIFFSSNIFFYVSDQAYDAVNSLAIPLLHTWSLSVEEQFYIFFPFLIIFLFKKFTTENRVAEILTIIIILSLIFAILGSINFESLNFYILPSRIWELLSGSLYFFYENKKKNNNETKNIKKFPFIGLFMIFFSFVFINDRVLHPSIITIVPIIGTILILNYSKKGEIVTDILSCRLFVGLGLISYSLYLWHYPIFAFSRIHLIGSDNIYGQLLVALSVVLLSIFTYFFIERPFRNKKFVNKKNFFLTIIISTVCLITTSLIIINSNGLKSRIKKFENYEFDNKLLGKQANTFTDRNSKNILFSKKSSEKILIIGDSHAKDMFNVFYLNQKLFEGKEFIQINLIKNSFSYDKNKKKLLEQSNVLLLSLNWRWSNEYPGLNGDNKDVLKKINEFSIQNKKKLIIVLKRPVFNFLDNGMTPTDNYLFSQRHKKVDWANIKENYSKKYYKMLMDDKKINQQLIMFSKENNIQYIDPFKYTCSDIKKTCDALTDKNEKIFYDHNHYSLEGAKYFGKKISDSYWFNLKN